MIDGVGRAQGPRPVAVAGEASSSVAVAKAGAGRDVAPQEAAVSNLGRIARDLAASPPVDTAKVAALRMAIASGDYKPDPERIAAAMISLETPVKD